MFCGGFSSHGFHLSVGYAFINFEDVSELDTISHYIELTLFQPIDIIDVCSLYKSLPSPILTRHVVRQSSSRPQLVRMNSYFIRAIILMANKGTALTVTRLLKFPMQVGSCTICQVLRTETGD